MAVGALVVSGLNSTSVTITLPDTDNSCKPYYVWISAITPNGQQSPYSKRRQVEVCRSGTGEECKLYGMMWILHWPVIMDYLIFTIITIHLY